jgi:hypothetical protein
LAKKCSGARRRISWIEMISRWGKLYSVRWGLGDVGERRPDLSVDLHRIGRRR